MAKKLNSAFIILLLLISVGFGFRYFFGAHAHNGGGESTAPLFAATFPNEKGVQVALKQYQGKTVVLNFWATWCEPCREEMPELSQLHLENSAKNIVVLGLAIDDVATISDFSKEVKVAYPLLAADFAGMDLATSLGNNKGVLPYTIIIKPDGTIAKTFFGRVTNDLLMQTLNTI